MIKWLYGHDPNIDKNVIVGKYDTETEIYFKNVHRKDNDIYGPHKSDWVGNGYYIQDTVMKKLEDDGCQYIRVHEVDTMRTYEDIKFSDWKAKSVPRIRNGRKEYVFNFANVKDFVFTP